MGKKGMKLMQTYQDSLETMNHEAVSISVEYLFLKVFGQTIYNLLQSSMTLLNHTENLRWLIQCHVKRVW